MTSTPAFHPQSLELPNRAPLSPKGTGAPMGERQTEVEDILCTPDFDPSERRTYGGVDASRLAGLAAEMLERRVRIGFGSMVHKLFKLPHKIRHGLYIYSRVKAALKKLSAPITLEVKVKDGTYVPRVCVYAKEPEIETCETDNPITSNEDWVEIDRARGHDVRGTSLHWVELRVSTVRSNARKSARRSFIKREGLAKAKPSSAQLSAIAREQKRRAVENRAFKARAHAYEPPVNLLPKTLPTYGEIWPPVPLPDRKTVSVTVHAVPATTPRPTVEEIDPIIGIEGDYALYTTKHVAYVQSGPKWDLPAFVKPPERFKPP